PTNNESPVAHAASVLLQDGRVLQVGGVVNLSTMASDGYDIYDPVLGAWTAGGSMPTAREGTTATGLGNGRVLVVGGSDGTDALRSADIYNPATDSWSSAASMGTARLEAVAILLRSGKVLVAGGDDGARVLDSAELYDPSTNHWTT